MNDDNRHDPLTLSDEHLNQINRFLGLPQQTAKELKAWRGYLRWMQGRFAPRPPPSSDKLSAKARQ